MLCGGSWIVFILDGLLLTILSSFFPEAAVLLPFIYYFLEKQLVKAWNVEYNINMTKNMNFYPASEVCDGWRQ
jgi:hypothetical protein